jgi:protein-S-isoprenylcysteine O-methyltransferase Ste14
MVQRGVILSWIIVVGRLALVARMFAPLTWPSVVYGVSELSVLIFTSRQLLLFKVDNSLLGMLLPFCYLSVLLLRPTTTPTHFGIVLMIMCFGLVAMRIMIFDRLTCGVATFSRILEHWPYSMIRHPQVLCELFAATSFVLTFPTSWNIGTIFFVYLALVSSIPLEERFLFNVEAYRMYAAQVTWRLIPGVW